MDVATPSRHYTVLGTMHDEHEHLSSHFMRLPTELRIDFYERIFNASRDNSLLPNPLDPRVMQKAMLPTLHINRAIRNTHTQSVWLTARSTALDSH
jgi:hypothetical protein